MFVNQCVNHAFGQWVVGAPSFYASQLLAATTEVQLDKRSPREHPQRGVIAAANARGDAYVYEGLYSYRANILAAAVIDDWRLWPDSDNAFNTYTVAHLGPFVIQAGVNDTINFDEGGAGMTATLTAGNYSATTLAAEVVVQLTAAGATNPTCVFNEITRHFWIGSGAVAFNIAWLTSNAAATLGYNANDAGALNYESDFAVPVSVSPPVYRSYEGRPMSVSVAARCSVAENLLRVRIVGLDGGYAIAGYFVDGRWQAAAGFNTFRLQTTWRVLGVTFEIPEGIRYFLWQVSNGTAGAQVIDLGRFWVPYPLGHMAGVGVRV